MNSTINVFKHKLYFVVLRPSYRILTFALAVSGRHKCLLHSDGIPTAVGCHLEAQTKSIFWETALKRSLILFFSCLPFPSSKPSYLYFLAFF